MRTWKLVSGILSIILFVLVAFQSCAAGVSNTLAENGEVSGSAGLIVAIMLLVGGIVSIATRNGGKGGNIAIIILYGIGRTAWICARGELYRLIYMVCMVPLSVQSWRLSRWQKITKNKSSNKQQNPPRSDHREGLHGADRFALTSALLL